MATEANDIGQRAADWSEEARHQAQQKVEDLKEQASEYLDRGMNTARHFGGLVERQIREQPTRSALIAAGIGFALGLVWMRRR